MMNRNKGTWGSRILIWIFAILLSILFYWLLGFVISDIGTLPGPSFSDLEAKRLDPAALAEAENLNQQLITNRKRIYAEKEKQTTLRDSTDSSQRTMNQLLEFQKLNIQQGTTPNDEERSALVESEQIFLANQREYQRLNTTIATLEEEVRKLEEAKLQQDAALGVARVPVYAEFQRLDEQHRWYVAMYKLGVLLPLLMIGLWLYLKYRSGPYWALIYAFGIAVVIKVGMVMHDYFPASYFKYVLLFTLLLVTFRILVFLLGAVAFPKKEWLLKQYREAYESFLCPICEHPIRRGPLKYMAWTKRSIRRMSTPAIPEGVEESYCCPACTTSLFAPCASCGKIRHVLLPACSHCGAENELA